MNPLLIIAILIISTVPLFAQAQPDPAKLKADAQRVVGIIKGDKAKTETFCQMGILGKQVDEATQENDTTKLEDLAQRIVEGEKELGPEYLALVDTLRNFDFDSKDGQEILSTFNSLNKSCPH